MQRRSWKWLGALALSLLVLGCSEDEPAPKKEPATPVKILLFEADPAEVVEGESTTLRWKTENAVELELFEDDVPISLPEGSVAEGEMEITPGESTSFVLVARGKDGSETTAQASVTVISVERPFVQTFEADPAEIPFGEASTLRWTVGNASWVTIHAGDELLHEGPDLEGSLPIEPAQSQTYTLVANSGDEEARAEATVLVVPLIKSFTVAPSLATAEGEEGKARIEVQWEIEGALGVTLSANGQTILDEEVGEPTVRDGIDLLVPPGKFQLTLEAKGALDAKATASEEVQVFGAPAVAIQGPSLVGVGDTFRLRWTATNTVTLDILKDGLFHQRNVNPASGEIEVTIEEAATFTFRATNAAGDTKNFDWRVEVGPPKIHRFEPEAERVAAGASYRLVWETLGAMSFEIRDGDGNVLLSTTDHARMAEGALDGIAPAGISHLDFVLVVSNASGREEARTRMLIGDGPAILRFEADRDAITLGETVELSWEVVSDVDGNAPTVVLTGPDGPIEIGEENAVEVTPAEVGTAAYTLEVETPRGKMEATVEVEVVPVPTLTFSVTPEVFDPSVHDLVTVEWTTENAASLEVRYAYEGGSFQQLLIAYSPAPRARSGSETFRPNRFPVTFRAIATSATGFQVVEEVEVQPAGVMVDLLASTTSVSGRQPVTLSWTSSGTPSTRFGSIFLGGTMDPFIDIRTQPGTYTFSIGEYGCYTDFEYRDTEGCVLLNFPDGFTFPFDGDRKSAARVYIAGFVSFDLTPKDGSKYPHSLTDPNTQWNGFVHLAPFWTNMSLTPYEGVRTGDIRYRLVDDPDGRYLVIQWSKLWPTFAYDDDPTDELTFQVILWEDGRFDYRYATMKASGIHADVATGAKSSIGVRFSPGNAIQISLQQPFPGGLQNFGFRFAPPVLPPSGSIEVVPIETTTYTLWSADGSASDSVTVTVGP